MPPVRLPKRNNIECPECGSILTRCRGGGRSAEGYRLRRRVCDDCTLIFTTAEVVLLYDDGRPTPISALDEEHRYRNQQEQRKRIGYHGTRGGRRAYAESARVSIRVRVSDPVRKIA